MATIYWKYEELLAQTRHRAQEVTVLGNTVDGSPIVVARGGGDKEPAVFITAGSHATEHAGVAAVQLIDELDSEHQVFVIPTRDPVAHDGFAHALSLGLGETPDSDDFDQLEEILRGAGTILFEDDDFLLTLIGDYGYASARPSTDRDVVEYGHEQYRAGPKRKNPQGYGYGRMQQIYREQPEILAPLLGRRVYQRTRRWDRWALRARGLAIGLGRQGGLRPEVVRACWKS